LALGCKGPKALDTRINARPATSLQAEAVKQADHWSVSLRLPAGTWNAVPFETQAMEIRKEGDGILLAWKVSAARWANHEKPFIFDLVAENGTHTTLTIRYPRPADLAGGLSTLGQNLVLLVFGGSGRADLAVKESEQEVQVGVEPKPIPRPAKP
jgi:hypothetical protein